MCNCNNIANNLFGVQSVENAAPPMQFKSAVIAEKVPTPTTQQLVDQAFAEIGNYDDRERWIEKSKQAYEKYKDENFAWEWLTRAAYAIIGNYTDVNKWAEVREEIRVRFFYPKRADNVADAFWNYYQSKLQTLLPPNNKVTPGTTATSEVVADAAPSTGGMSTSKKVMIGLTVIGSALLLRELFKPSRKSSGLNGLKTAKNGKKLQRGANGQFKKVQKISY